MRIACSVTDFFDADLARAAEIAAGAGFSAIELFVHSQGVFPCGMTACPAAGIRQGFAQRGLVISSLNIGNLAAVAEEQIEASVSARLAETEYARQLGLSAVNLKGGERAEQSIATLVASLNGLCERMPDGASINLGNHHGNRVENGDDLAAILAETDDRVRVLVDSGHFISAGVDPVEIASAFPGRIGLVHLRDQIDGAPVPFGRGELRFDELFAVIRSAGYHGWVIVELERLQEPPDIVERHRVAREFVEARLGASGVHP